MSHELPAHVRLALNAREAVVSGARRSRSPITQIWIICIHHASHTCMCRLACLTAVH